MNKRFPLQFVFGLGVALLLFFLFWKSQVDVEGHSRNINTLLTLQRDEAEFRRLLEQGFRGGLRNYDPFISVQKRRLQAIKQLEGNLHEVLPDKLILVQARRILEEYQYRAPNIERFKQHLATRSLAQLYFPQVSRELLNAIQLADSSLFSAELNRQDLLDQVVGIHTTLDSHLMGEGDLRVSVEKDLFSLREAVSKVKGELVAQVASFSHYAMMQQNATAKSKALLLTLGDGAQQAALRQLHQAYLRNYDVVQKQSAYYRLALFALAIILLAYLAKVFLSLEATSTRLRESIQALDFRQFAIDQHAIVSVTNLQGKITYANDRFCEVSQYSRAELLGKNHNILKSGEHDDAFYRDIWRTISRGDVWHGVMCNKAKNGSLYWLDSTLLARLDSSGRIAEYIAIRTDVSAKVLAERDIGWLARLPEENPDPVMRLDQNANILYANTAAKKMLDLCREDKGSCREDVLRLNVAKVLEYSRVEEQMFTAGGHEFSLTLAPVVDANYVNVYARDVTEKRAAERLLNFQASHDQLTGLANRHHFEKILDEVVEAARLEEAASMLLYMDLDQFKVVNDTCGHVAGDELLRQLGSCLSNNVRDQDVLARLGGDEFALLLRNCDREHGMSIAKKLLRVIGDFTFVWENRSFGIGVSIGAVLIDEHSNSRDTVLASADIACYSAKDAGRNRVSFYRMDDAEANQRRDEMHWASLIPEALVNDKFVLMVQSIIPLQEDSQRGGHYEVLVRMRDADGGLIPPGAFIPAAERYGLMSAIDSWVVRRVLDVMADLRIRGANLNDWRFAVNLSGASMGDKAMLDYIKEEVVTTGIPPGSLSFEVTETAAVSNLSDAIEFIQALRDMGCHFALDDFGSGLSSFAYLKNLPVDYLKIDGAFVRDILDDEIDAAMVKSINEIGHVMGIETIAEFVENDQIKERLRQMGVDFAQGYGIDKPQELDPLIAARLIDEPFLISA